MKFASRQYRTLVLLFSVSIFVAVLNGCTAGHHSLVLYSNDSSQQAAPWTQVSPGLTYSNILVGDNNNPSEFFMVKVDPRLYEFRVYSNDDRLKAKTLQEVHKQEGSLLTFNGAFFDTNFQAMGLLQDSQKQIHKVAQSDLMDGIFQLKCQPTTGSSAADLLSLDEYAHLQSPHSCDFLIQNGPVLLDNAGNIQITKDSGKTAARTSLAVDENGNVVVIILYQNIVSNGGGLSLYQFAHILKESQPFVSMGLHSVLNLDGGPSTGIVVGGEYLPEVNPVENVVITVPRK